MYNGSLRSTPARPAHPSRRARRRIGSFALLATIAAGSTACGDDSSGSVDKKTPQRGETTTAAVASADVKLVKEGCSPTELTAPSGAITFNVINERDIRNEFEILNQTPEIVIEEFLEPGAIDSYTVDLKPGAYTVLCNPVAKVKATLTVTGDAPTSTTAPTHDVAAMTAAIASYRQYVLAEVETLATGTRQFTDAIRSGDLAGAQSLYATVRVPWERIEPVAELFPDSDALIDSRADDHELKESDPGFTGFHRLEYGLFDQQSTDGLAPFADQLDTDLAALIVEINELDIAPSVMVNGPGALIEETAQTKITGEEERYSRTDLVTFWANVEGSEKIIDLIDPMITAKDPNLSADLASSFSQIQELVAPYRTAEAPGFMTYDKLSTTDVDRLKTTLAQLAEDLSQVGGVLGIEVKE